MILATPVRAAGDCIIDHAGRVVAITNAPGAAERATWIAEACNRFAAELQAAEDRAKAQLLRRQELGRDGDKRDLP